MTAPLAVLPWQARLLRRLPPGLRGKARLARLLLRGWRGRSNVCIQTPDGCSFWLPHLGEPVAFHLLADGVYEPALARFLAQRLPPGGTFVDVGANVGAFTVPVARRLGAAGLVVAVEASPAVFPYLEANVRDNGLTNVRLHPCAATDGRRDEAPFYEAPADHFGMGALAAQFGARPVSVPARTLDDLLAADGVPAVDLLKVDVEGFEADVFRGARRLLSCPRPPLVAFEFCDWAEERNPGARPGDAQRFLLERGFALFVLHEGGGLVPTGAPLIRGDATLVGMPPGLALDSRPRAARTTS